MPIQDNIPAGSRVAVRNALCGTTVLEIQLTSSHCVWSAKRIVRLELAASVHVPWQCVKLIDWECPSDTHDNFFEASFIWNPVDSFYLTDTVEGRRCPICHCTCTDTEAQRSHCFNCIRCRPRFLCHRCRIRFPIGSIRDPATRRLIRHSTAKFTDSWPICFWCLEPSDFEALQALGLSEVTRRRLGLLSGVCIARTPVVGFTSWWDSFVTQQLPASS